MMKKRRAGKFVRDRNLEREEFHPGKEKAKAALSNQCSKAREKEKEKMVVAIGWAFLPVRKDSEELQT